MKRDSLESESNDCPISASRPSGKWVMTAVVALMLSFLELGVPSSVVATSFFPVQLYHRQEKLETSIRTGETVYLFHSGTRDVTRGIHPGDVLTVHRTSSSCQAKVVGKIKVLSYVGETYIKGEVMEGEVRADDIATGGDVSCLVVSVGICDHEK